MPQVSRTDPCLSGERLRGDDFPPEEVERWFREEREAYFSLRDRSDPRYEYHALNRRHAWRHLPPRDFESALLFGGARGDEILPIAPRVRQVTILDPAAGFRSERSVEALPSGDLPFPAGAFDLITCFGALHHVANVTHVLREMRRCLRPGGYAVIREPTISMGDWRRPRPGLTKNERGIPLLLLREMLNRAGFRVLRESRCVFPAVRRLWPGRPYDSTFAVALDSLLSRLFSFQCAYHPTRWWRRLQPAAAAYVLT